MPKPGGMRGRGSNGISGQFSQHIETAVQATRASEAEARAEQASAETQEARHALDQIRRKTRGRLRRAWDGWRGR